MTIESRPTEPGFSGRESNVYSVPRSLLEQMNEALQPATGRLGSVRTSAPRVLSAKLEGRDAKGRSVYTIAIKSDGRVKYLTRAWTGSGFRKPSGNFGFPSHPSADVTSQQSASRSDPALDAAKDQWLTTIANLTASPFHKQNLVRAVKNHRGDASSLNEKMARLVKAMAPIDATVEPRGGEQPFDPFAGIDFGGGFGGGGGISGPTYVAPDRRVVEDFVTGALVSLVGTVPSDDMVDQFTDLYMADHRKNFDVEDREIDPSQSVKEAIRQTEAYQTIHKNRPDSEDERSWVAKRRQAAAQGGLTVDRQEDFAIDQAIVGSTVEDTEEAAATAQFRASGQAPDAIQRQIAGIARSMFTGVRI